MQAQTPEVSAEKATTLEELEVFKRALHSQKMFKLSSATIDAAEWAWFARPAQAEQQTHVECRECAGCGHIGINDALETNAACGRCSWIGPSPDEDKCPGCAAYNVMSAACPKCSCIYRLLADAEIATPIAQTAPQCNHRFMHFGDQKKRRCADCCVVEGSEHAAPQLGVGGPMEVLREAERFIAGFEGCELQEGIDELLMRIRVAQSVMGGV